MEGSFEQRYEDVLQNIEFGIVSVFHEEPDLLDLHVEDALNALISTYQAELKGRLARASALNPLPEAVRASVQAMCDWRMGRGSSLETVSGGAPPQPAPVSVDEMVACLKRVRKSVQFWTREGGRQGYLRYVSDFIG